MNNKRPVTNVFFSLMLSLLFIECYSYGQCQIGDCINSFGVRVYADSGKFEGLFEKGTKKHGTYYYKSGDIYDGAFSGNLRDGYGKYTYASGEFFQGMYKLDKKEYGIYKYKSGNFFVGTFEQNKPEGFGTLYRSNGKSIEGFWVDGRPIWSISTDSLAYFINDSATTEYQPASLAEFGQKGNVPKIFAVVVGISDYHGYSVDLQYADDDARIFYGYLKKAFPTEAGSGNVTLLLDGQATYSNIIATLRKTFASATEDDYIMFYFSGHGAPGTFVPADHQGYELSHSEVKEIFKSSKAKYRLCIADACFAGTVASPSSPFAQYEAAENLRDSRLAVMLSSSASQTSAEMPDLGQGLFSYWLMRGIRGSADMNGDKYVTAGELFVYTRDAVYRQSGGRQAPVIIGQQLNRIPLSKIR